ncbi:MAG: O-acetyl-ADP-ribose deacetylase [Actinomycetota bacterium]|nr:O-acetyl-ADP-ribose deacetylase [Actinomycetota bacterium]
MQIEVVRGDLTVQEVDAIVNAANSSLLGGGGVDGAIHLAAGPALLAACEELRSTTLPEGLRTGRAVATPGFDLPARWVIHTVGPIYDQHDHPEHLLASCYVESLRVADEIGATTVAFPAISCGIYGYPVREAAPIAVETVRSCDTNVELVRFVLFGDETHGAFTAAVGP